MRTFPVPRLYLDDRAACHAPRCATGAIRFRPRRRRQKPSCAIDDNLMAFPAAKRSGSLTIDTESHGVAPAKVTVWPLARNSRRRMESEAAVAFRILASSSESRRSRPRRLLRFSQVRRKCDGAIGKPAGQVMAGARKMVGIIVEAATCPWGVAPSASRISNTYEHRSQGCATGHRVAETQIHGVVSLLPTTRFWTRATTIVPGVAHRVGASTRKSSDHLGLDCGQRTSNPPSCRELLRLPRCGV